MQPAPPRLAKFTTWHNPTPKAMFVDVIEGEGKARTTTRYEFPPGKDVQVPSRYDGLIHRVDCGQEECHRQTQGGGYFCTKGHQGVIIGGAAPLLQRVGASDQLLESLDPDIAEKKAAEARRAASLQAARDAEDAAIIAQRRASEAGGSSEDRSSEDPAKVAPKDEKPPKKAQQQPLA